jgi:hypothetical protein
MRRYEEPIEVREAHQGQGHVQASGPADGSDPGQPTAFVWRGRLYVVRDVLGHWRERRAWWRDALDPREAPVRAAAAPTRPGGPVVAPDLEQDVWRVTASPGRMLGTGVYDLARDGQAPRWRLVRVAD